MGHDINFQTAALLTLAGAVGGFLNTVASSGSAVTLPVMIALGLHPMLANTTNRVPVLLGFAAAVWKYHRANQLPWRVGLKVSIPLILGALLGSMLASALSDLRTVWLTIFAVVLGLLVVLCNPSKWLSADDSRETSKMGPLIVGVLFAVGIWAGVIVLDTGIYLLATLVMLAHYPIREANAIKALGIGLMALLSVIVFSIKGEIDWLWAIPLSVGGIMGSVIGTRFSLGPNAAKWVFWMLVLILGIEVVKLCLRFL